MALNPLGWLGVMVRRKPLGAYYALITAMVGLLPMIFIPGVRL